MFTIFTGNNIYPGGIGVWGKCILDYYHQSGSDIDIIPVSFDRHLRIGEVNDFGIKRIFNGVVDLGKMTLHAYKEIKRVKPNVMNLCTSASLGLIKDWLLLSVAKRCNIKTVLHLHFGRTPDLQKVKNWEWMLLNRVIRLAYISVAMDMQTYSILKAEGYNVKYLPNPLSMNIINQVQQLEGTIERIPNQLLFVGHALKTRGGMN